MIFIKKLQEMLKKGLILQIELSRPLPKEKKKKVVELMKDELGGKSMKKFVRLITKNYSYLKDGGSEDKKAKDTKKCVIRKILNLKIMITV